MPEFRIGQFRYTWTGPWLPGTNYRRDDVVSYGGGSFVCVVTHTADDDFYTDLNYILEGDTAPTPRWKKMTDGGFRWRGDWEGSVKYAVGDVVYEGGNLWRCTDDHTSQSDIDSNISDWEIYAEGQGFKQDWEPGTRYSIGDVVRYGGNTLRCIKGHTSGTEEEGVEVGDNDGFTDSRNETWEVLYYGAEFAGEWAVDVRYKLDELVLYNGTLLRCIAGHSVDAETHFDESKWQVELYGGEFEQEWVASGFYGIGSVVRYGGYLWIGIRPSYNKNPLNRIYPANELEDYWDLLAETSRYRGEWTSGSTYLIGDLVRKGGVLYRSKIDNIDDLSTLDYLDDTNWEIVVPGQSFRGDWAVDGTYFPGDMVIFEGDIWKCIYGNIADAQNFPGDNGSGYNYWTLAVETPSKQGMRRKGDLLTYDLSRDLAGDTSTFGPTGVHMFDQPPENVLTISNEDQLFYTRVGDLNRTFFVSPSGVDNRDEPNRGTNVYKPFKTIRYAAEVADDGFSGYTTIQIGVGRYYEVLPIIVPARTALVGSELRATEVYAKEANPALANDLPYSTAALSRLSSIIPGVLLNDPNVPRTPGNTVEIVTGTRTVTYEDQRFDPETGEEFFVTVTEDVPLEASPEAIGAAQALIIDIVAYIDYHLGTGESEPTLVGTNTAITDQTYLDAIELLRLNYEFFREEVSAYIAATYSSYVFDAESCKRDVRAYVDAIRYDLEYTGNYKSLLAARYYRNAVRGSQIEDMFYVRDASGIRNMSCFGLSGTLNPPETYDLYRRPTGGSFVSLDPGWGPADERVWINTRSPYMQGCTNFGEGVTGIDIDGSLHNGGNKSMVANDYTQILSDGIGARVANNGRAELISVFTYYCSIGYLAEQGGVIRAANGNNSYGRYGAISDGVDSTETPQEVTLNNRNNQAIVASTFAGEFNDEIYAFEFQNAGQHYTQATATIVGAGINASVQFEEFRDNAVFECRLLDTTPDSIAQNIGGSGYSIAQNNAQPNLTPNGDLTTITLASNDANTEADYLGKRIVITGGTGTGQYGYIGAYNDSTKVVSVYKESNGQPGWDHIVPGTPVKIPLDTTTFYRIEPRVIFEDPGFTASNVTAPANTVWGAVDYAETYETYNGLEGVYSGDNTVVSATFDVIKNGREYTVNIVGGGAGYTVGDALLIEGTLLGGTNYNDITIRVTTVSADSTQSITGFVYDGVGRSGVYVATSASGGQAATWSYDGTTWQAPFLMPSAGNWSMLAGIKDQGETALTGNVRFVAIKEDSNNAAYSFNGRTWTARTLPSTRSWSDLAYGGGRFLAVAADQNTVIYSSNGINWSSSSIPATDSTFDEWIGVAYGKNKWVAVSRSSNMSAVSEDGGATWTTNIMDVIDDSSQRDWIGVAYGNDRFVACSTQGDVAYSFNGTTWYAAEMPSQDGSTAHFWKQIKYANGVFMAVGDTGGRSIGDDPTTGPSNYAATSPDGIHWDGRTMSSSQRWRAIGYGNPYIESEDSTVGRSTPVWVAVAETNVFNRIRTGARAKGRVTVGGGVIGSVRIWDPGSGYRSDPIVTLVDPNVSTDAEIEVRSSDGVLTNPTWLNRGTGYRSVSTRVTIAGNGYADIIPVGKYLTIDGLTTYPGPGAQVILGDTLYTIVAITELGQLGTQFDGLSAYVRVSPDIKVRDNLQHGTEGIVREKYSQCRITGHDFLDIGTGNFLETNYPALYSGLYTLATENEVYEEDGGRVFYTSTDQSGNFRCGELFAVEQATGIVTISADFFDFSGLTELRLGGIRVGGTGAVIREFSTDPTFTEDSNNIVPTQRAISSYLANRLSVGGSEIATASFIAGLVLVGPDRIRNTLGGKIIFPVRADFEGPTAGVSGSILAQSMFLATGDDF